MDIRLSTYEYKTIQLKSPLIFPEVITSEKIIPLLDRRGDSLFQLSDSRYLSNLKPKLFQICNLEVKGPGFKIQISIEYGQESPLLNLLQPLQNGDPSLTLRMT